MKKGKIMGKRMICILLAAAFSGLGLSFQSLAQGKLETEGAGGAGKNQVSQAQSAKKEQYDPFKIYSDSAMTPEQMRAWKIKAANDYFAPIDLARKVMRRGGFDLPAPAWEAQARGKAQTQTIQSKQESR